MSFPTGHCARCNRHTGVTIMSKFNQDELCMECKSTETYHPDYQRASDAELEAVKAGDRNFAGIGLPQGYSEWAKRRIPNCPNCNGEREATGQRGIYRCFFCGHEGA
jgi:hypothetical protein